MEQEYKYMVATKCFTFNHACYIKDALAGFSNQEVTFPVVYCIVDDASTDGEPEVLRKWAEQNLEIEEEGDFWRDLPYGKVAEATLKWNANLLFVIILLAENFRGQNKPKKPLISEWMECAKYHAYCEGDDYWLDATKLQKQVSFLECHEDVSLCFHPVKITTENIRVRIQNKQGYSSINDLCFGNYIATGSVVCRNDKRIDCYAKKRIKRSHVGDYQTYMYYALIGDLYSLDSEMSVYRVHAENSWRGSSTNEKKIDYNNFLYNLLLLDEMPLFPRLVLKIRYLINKAIINQLEESSENNNKEDLHNNKIGRFIFIIKRANKSILSFILAIFTVLESLNYRIINLVKR